MLELIKPLKFGRPHQERRRSPLAIWAGLCIASLCQSSFAQEGNPSAASGQPAPQRGARPVVPGSLQPNSQAGDTQVPPSPSVAAPSNAIQPGQLGAPQAGAPQAGAPQVGAPQVGAPQVGAPQTGAPEVAPPTTPPQATPQPVSPQVQQQVSSNVQSAAQLQTSNLFARGSGRINIISDFFGTGPGQVTVALPFTFTNVPSVVLGPSALGFDVNGGALDLFTVGPADPTFTYSLAEPTQPTGAPIPNNPGFQYAGGVATPSAPLNFQTQGAPYDLTYAYSNTLLIPAGSNLLLGRQKIAANVSPMPRTRVFADYSYFNETQLLTGADVHRWTPGFEYAFDEQTSSVEMRVPMGITINSEIFSDSPDESQYEFGNLFFAWKSLLIERRNWLLSGGVSVTVPTAEDVNVRLGTPASSIHILQIKNESVHVQPFLGWWAQDGDWFTQGFVQLDLDVNGSSVLVNRNLNSPALSHLGTVQNTNLMYVDWQVGYWLRRADRRHHTRNSSSITGLAPICELHLNQSLHASDVVGSATDILGSGGYQIGAPLKDVQLINAIVGVMVEHNFDTQVYLGYATPLGNGADAAFDGELRVALNRFY